MCLGIVFELKRPIFSHTLYSLLPIPPPLLWGPAEALTKKNPKDFDLLCIEATRIVPFSSSCYKYTYHTTISCQFTLDFKKITCFFKSFPTLPSLITHHLHCVSTTTNFTTQVSIYLYLLLLQFLNCLHFITYHNFLLGMFSAFHIYRW